ncbi:MAG: hypothetical protein EXX96DRAFT_562072 [Benjaminiella poitrasii]|nr:MAG: hypothetical protein EXX96DRAFT_562072 [Benjaminiella poitrasii]
MKIKVFTSFIAQKTSMNIYFTYRILFNCFAIFINNSNKITTIINILKYSRETRSWSSFNWIIVVFGILAGTKKLKTKSLFITKEEYFDAVTIFCPFVLFVDP